VAWNRHYYRIKGNRHYELTNHLGNVLAVVTDRKLGQDTTVNATYTPQYYLPDIYSVQNYYAFGQNLPKWSSSALNDPKRYRFGFNGKEDDDEWTKQDYGFRMYDPRVARFLSVDPLAAAYPWYTPYQFAGDMPIWAADLDGLEPDFKGSSEGQAEITSEQGSGDVYAWSWTGSEWHRGLKEVTKTGSKKGSTPKYTQEIPVGDGANWLTRATIATHSIDYKRDVSGLYTFADKTPEYWAHALELMFAAEGIVDLGLYLGRRGAMAVTAKGVTAEVEAGAVEATKTSSQILSWGNNAKGHLIKHADVLGFGGHTPQQLQKMLPQLRGAANQLLNAADATLTRVGQWHGHQNALMYISNGKMLVTEANGTFISVINKTSNNWYNIAKPLK
jgi:RHS repeat-associated protein